MINFLISILPLLGINIILSSSLNIINGYCGLFSLGHAGFFAVGAYATASATMFWFPGLTESAPILALLLGCLVGMVVAGLVGLAVGLPCLRLTGDYLAIATVGFGEIIRIVLLNMDSVGGSRGLTGVPKLTEVWIVYALVALTIWLIHNLMRSSYGRAILSVREDEIAARSMGINVRFFKTFAFVIGSALAGMAGGLFAHEAQFLHPNNFDFMITVQILLMVVLGGMGSQRGAIVGAIIVTLVPELLRMNEFLSQFRNLTFGVIMIVVMLWKPQGLMGIFDRRSLKVKEQAA